MVETSRSICAESGHEIEIETRDPVTDHALAGV